MTIKLDDAGEFERIRGMAEIVESLAKEEIELLPDQSNARTFATKTTGASRFAQKQIELHGIAPSSRLDP